eukprot:gb/GECG01006827.1/.p1 GENE.gb/GECG01006827.1/~~gb/GECG01006827.1/.p1  ORF type:complete len:324 (+),score=18.96 gb/GECG01006827.1/:1-972(+)
MDRILWSLFLCLSLGILWATYFKVDPVPTTPDDFKRLSQYFPNQTSLLHARTTPDGSKRFSQYFPNETSLLHALILSAAQVRTSMTLHSLFSTDRSAKYQALSEVILQSDASHVHFIYHRGESYDSKSILPSSRISLRDRLSGEFGETRVSPFPGATIRDFERWNYTTGIHSTNSKPSSLCHVSRLQAVEKTATASIEQSLQVVRVVRTDTAILMLNGAVSLYGTDKCNKGAASLCGLLGSTLRQTLHEVIIYGSSVCTAPVLSDVQLKRIVEQQQLGSWQIKYRVCDSGEESFLLLSRSRRNPLISISEGKFVRFFLSMGTS